MKRKIVSGIMLTLLLTTMLSIVFVTPAKAQYSVDPYTVALWHFDEGEGNIAYDTSPNANHGTIYGATWVPGMFGKALQFDGIDDYVEVPDNVSLRPSAFTIECWIKGAEPGALVKWQHIVSKHERYGDVDGTPFRGYVLQVSELRLCFSLGIVTYWSHIFALETYEVGVWYHLMGPWDGTTQKFYINGVLQGSATPIGFEHTIYPLRFGRRSENDPDLNPRYFKGVIDEIRISNVARETAPISVGGIYIPVNKLELLAPYIELTILLAVAAMTVGYVKKRKRNTEINS